MEAEKGKRNKRWLNDALLTDERGETGAIVRFLRMAGIRSTI